MLYALLVGRGQQRVGVRRHQREHDVVRNTTLGLTMLFGRFFMIIPPLAIAGSLSRKKQIPASLGTFPVTTPLFTALLVGVIVIVGALTFFPALSLGPIVEHFMLNAGQVF
jgi:K+-transporting ATPase ATPase A chain